MKSRTRTILWVVGIVLVLGWWTDLWGDQGYDNGYQMGLSDGIIEGYDFGETSGRLDGFNVGYRLGFRECEDAFDVPDEDRWDLSWLPIETHPKYKSWALEPSVDEDRYR